MSGAALHHLSDTDRQHAARVRRGATVACSEYTFLIATVSPVCSSFALHTTPNAPWRRVGGRVGRAAEKSAGDTQARQHTSRPTAPPRLLAPGALCWTAQPPDIDGTFSSSHARTFPTALMGVYRVSSWWGQSQTTMRQRPHGRHGFPITKNNTSKWSLDSGRV